MNSTQKKVTWHGPKQVGTMIFTGFMMLFCACLVGGQSNTVLPALCAERGWDFSTIVVWAGISGLLLSLGNIIFTATMRKLQPKIIIATTLFAMAILLVVFGLTQNITVFVIVMMLMAIASGGYYMSGTMQLTANWWPTKKGIVFGWTTMGIVLMGVLYVPYMPNAYAAFGILATQIVLAAIVAIFGIICLLFIKNTPEAANTYPDGDVNFAEGAEDVAKAMAEYKSPFTTAKVFKQGSTWTVSIAFFLLYVAAMTFIGAAIPTFMSYGYEISTAKLVFTVGSIVALGGSWLWGVIDFKVGTKKSSVWLAVVMFIAIIFAALSKTNIFFVWAATIILMGCNGGLGNLIPSYVGTIYGRWDYSAGYKVIGTITQLGGGTGIMCIGLFHSTQTMFIFDLVIVAISFVLLLVTKSKFIGKAG